MKKFLCLVLSLLCYFSFGNDLLITLGDTEVTQGVDGGYHLWIRKKPGLNSVLLTESTKDPLGKAAVYALRDPEYHPVNGDEPRMLDGKLLDEKARGRYSLIDSTPEAHERFGQAFHLYIPYIVVYGYPWSRSGEIQVLDGTFLNIRAFSQIYGDYRGSFQDNPFTLRVIQKPLAGPKLQNIMPDTVESFRSIAEAGRGEVLISSGEEDLIQKLEKILDQVQAGSLDLVVAIDTTRSMLNDIDFLKKAFIPLLEEKIHGIPNLRVGMVLYKDYYEQYLTKTMPFERSLGGVQRFLDTIQVYGGRDIPEAVYEALYAAVHSFNWEADKRMIVLIGDAPPHPRPRGKITKDMVYKDAEAHQIIIDTIILPQ